MVSRTRGMDMRRDADAILTADLHLTLTIPPCRGEDYVNEQSSKLIQLDELQGGNGGCPILIAGDIFDHWKPSPELLSYASVTLPSDIVSIPGNHDLPAHSLERMRECGYYNLLINKKISIAKSWTTKDGLRIGVHGIPFGEPFIPPPPSTADNDINVVLIHEFAYKGRTPWPGAPGRLGPILEQLPGWDLIVCGDHHKTFHHETEDQLFVNPGSLMRRRSDQIKHKPCVYLWYAEDNSFEVHYFEIDPKAVSRTHLDVMKNRDSRIQSFVNKLSDDFEIEFSFESNMDKHTKVAETPKPVVQKIKEAMYG